MTSRSLFIIGFTFVSTYFAMGQRSGIITYAETIERNWRNRSFTEENTWKLAFTDSVAICTWVKPDEDEPQVSAGGVTIRSFRRQIEDHYVTYPRKKEVEDQREIFNKIFIVNGQYLDRKWKITGKQGVVLGYPCIEATLTMDTITILAWFTPRIPIGIGPREWRGLPGMILHMELDNGRHVITATKIEVDSPPSEADLQIPEKKKGEEIAWSEFEALRKEKEAEAREMFGR
ncbi:MAG: GLPGLI family protein [Bacteroidota bacterium]|nr:GLPGLI family protein [Bacteroidota bacterium]